MTLLAQFVGPAKVKEHFQVEHGVALTLQHITAYDPTRPQFRVAEKWRTIFWAARKRYMEEVGSIPIANQGFRLNLLHEAVLSARSRGNYVLMADLLEQAAKEVGGALTNKREVDLKDDRLMAELSEDERAERAARLFDQALGRDHKGKGGETVQ